MQSTSGGGNQWLILGGLILSLIGGVVALSRTARTKATHSSALTWAQSYAVSRGFEVSTNGSIIQARLDKLDLWKGAPRPSRWSSVPNVVSCVRGKVNGGTIEIAEIDNWKLSGASGGGALPDMSHVKHANFSNFATAIAVLVKAEGPPLDPTSFICSSTATTGDRNYGGTAEVRVQTPPDLGFHHVISTTVPGGFTAHRLSDLARVLSGWPGHVRVQGSSIMAWGWRTADPTQWTAETDSAIAVITGVARILSEVHNAPKGSK